MREVRRRSTFNASAADDDDEQPIWTFRVVFLGSMSFLFLFILSKYFLTQVGECVMIMLIASVVLYPLGWVMALFVSRRRVYCPSLGLEFSLNAGPFGLGEFALISIFANLGAAIGVLTSCSIDLLYTEEF